MDFKVGYYLLTISGQLRFRKFDEVDDPRKLFDDPFITRWWKVEIETDYIAMIIDVEHSVYNEIKSRETKVYHA